MPNVKNIIVCDSGLGGLDIAGHFFEDSTVSSPKWNVIYFNAYPDANSGYNDLSSTKDQEDLFRKVLRAMERYSPACCLVACNTLSIIYQRLATYFQPSFPVYGIIDTALNLMESTLKETPDSQVLILGTKSTIASQVYSNGLIERGIAPERIASLACPKLATLIEQDPAAEAVRQRIDDYAQMANSLFARKPNKLLLAFCCTHYGYATSFWQNSFARVAENISILNPNEHLRMPGNAASFQYLSKIPLLPNQRNAMAALFQRNHKEQIANALLNAVNNVELF